MCAHVNSNVKLACVFQVNSDGYLPNRKQNMAVGLAIIHVAQHLNAALRKLKQKHNKPGIAFTFALLFNTRCQALKHKFSLVSS